MNIAVVDDTRLDSEKLQRGIHRWFTENHDIPRSVTCFRDGESLLRVFEPEKFSMVFMDILMKDMSGIQAAERIRESDAHTLLIFTTASREYAFDTFPLHPFDYIIKPYEPARLGRVLSEAVRILEAPEPMLNVKVSRSTYSLPLREISAVISRDHFVEVVMTGRRCLLCSMSFREVEAELSKHPRFLFCNRGVAVNMDCVASITRDRDAFIMNDGEHYPVRVRGRKEILEIFTQYQITRIRRRISGNDSRIFP